MITIITFTVSAAIILGVWFLYVGESSQQIVRGRIEHLRAAQNWTGIAADLKLVRDEMVSTIPALHRLLAQAPGTTLLQKYLAQAGMKTKPAKIVLLCVLSAVATYVIVGHYLPFFLAAVAGIVAGAIPVGFVAWKRQARLDLFEERFPDALDMLGRAVRAGHAFTSAMQMVAQESLEPVGGEFTITYEEQNYGIPIQDALEHFAERVPSFDVRFLVTALIVQKDSGGNLAEILDQLSRVIRERFRIQRDVKTKTAMGRLTAGILIMLPLAMLGMMEFVNPDYESVLFHDVNGPMVLGLALLLQLVGAIILWRIVTIEV
jgi:tight adherence protein B